MQLSGGILTNTILGAYDYEGGDLDYTVTYGTRSVTEPEYEAPLTEAAADEMKPGSSDVWLYVGIGAAALAAIGGILLLMKKKKGTKA